jgi:hypothetical protein
MADWKEHKKTCSMTDEELAKAIPGWRSTINSWIQRQYYDYMKEFDRIMREKKIDKQELLLELDLYSDEQGSAPALRTPPEFKVGITRRYLERRGTEWYDADSIRDHYQRMTSNHLLVLVRNPDHSMSIYKLQIVSQTTGVGWYSDQAMDAFSRALRHDDSRLGQVYDASQLLQIKARRDVDTKN